jgi:hypothetical protein
MLAGSAFGSNAAVLAHLATLAKLEGPQAVRKEVEGSLPVQVAEEQLAAKSS